MNLTSEEKNINAIRWGDVLCAALDACCVIGPDEMVDRDSLLICIDQLNKISGGMDNPDRKKFVEELQK